MAHGHLPMHCTPPSLQALLPPSCAGQPQPASPLLGGTTAAAAPGPARLPWPQWAPPRLPTAVLALGSR